MTRSLSKTLLLLVTCFLTASLYAQTTVSILLSQGNGEDAYLAGGSPNSNYGMHPSMGGNTWTCLGNLCLSRAVFKFDMSTIPANVPILNASLELFADLGWSGSPTTGGPNNAGYINRITSAWAENAVTWNSQPSVSPVNQLLVPGSFNTAQNYTLNVTSLVQDIMNSPANYGFMLRMQDEVNYYKSLMFASSDNANSANCPILTVSYINPSVTVATSTLGCNGLVTATANVSGGSGNYSYTWTPSAQNGSVGTSLVPGVYTISVLDNTYNYNFSYTTTVLNPTANFTCTASSTPFCGTSNATVVPMFGSGTYNYLWSPGNLVSAAVSSLSAGIYTVSVLDVTRNCSINHTIQITPYSLPNLTVSPNRTICPKQAVTLSVSGANTYLWNTGSTATSVIVAPATNTFYTVSGTISPGNCSSTKTIAITVVPCTGISEYTAGDANVWIYPYPFESESVIECTVNMKKIIVFDLNGNKVLEEEVNAKIYSFVQHFPAGVYLLSVYGDNNKLISRKKIVTCN